MKLRAATNFKFQYYLKLLSVIGAFYIVFALVGPGLLSLSSDDKLGIWEPEILFSIYSALAIFFTSTTCMRFLFQNGASRKTMFLSTFFTLIIGNIICITTSQILKFIVSFIPNVHIINQFYSLYGHYFHSSILNHSLYLVLIFVVSLMISSFAMLLGTLFSLITKIMKMIIFGLIGFIVIFIVSIINMFNINIIHKLGFLLGNTHNVHNLHLFPIYPILFGLIIVFIFTFLHYLINTRIETSMIISEN
ncbi:hypothetical protein [Staphylococcus kloosii]|jgi:hypothetical protein|uniref:hypothetical protein n=1 Tax=Staphylococcus kloosii TaxID=29384 RepID=UPI0028A5581A|nr:hypothetical protein [Staphylococcus kloosii]MDT3958527.1 hypothetical protein [Staphylococcus kloosii]